MGTAFRELEYHLEIFTDSKDTKLKIDKLLSAFEENYENIPRYQSGKWDGKKRFYSTKIVKTGGVLFNISKGFKQRLLDNIDFDDIMLLPEDKPSKEQRLKFLRKILKELPFKARKYQLEAFMKFTENTNYFGSMCTSSGKSLVAYLVLRYYWEKGKKSILLVPTISLTMQMEGDFKDYNAPKDFLDNIKLIGGDNIDKDLTHSIVIGTYQSLVKVTHQMDDYDVILTDECHLASAESLQKILKQSFNNKLGMTGSVPIINVNLMHLIQIFGEPDFIIRARELMDMGLLTDSYIVTMFLSHQKGSEGLKSNLKYQDEVKYIKNNLNRKNFVKKFLRKLPGLSVALYHHNDHGEQTYFDLTGTYPDYNNIEKMKKLGVFFVSGKTKGKVREEIRQYTNTIQKGIIIANYKVFSTGINLPNITNIIFLSSTKSYVTILQSLGRVFRMKKGKNKAMIYDLVDIFPYKKESYSEKHFWQRLQAYKQEKHKILEKEIDLKKF
jgi:superfamily II DNA or RNA helicase